MKPENAIEVNNVKKRFKVYYDKGNSLKEKVLFWKRNRFESKWVLKGVSFEVKKGEAIGLIGKNGCGKSTTLKMLTRIMYPTSGTIEMQGRCSSLIELGAGFHPDMTGRENIFTNASIFGLSHKEIESRLDDIIAFSELEEFIDNPVRTYSSGMYMRLAFSVAINVDADILLIDEILAVGDVSFQAKCFEKLKDIKAKGTTIVIVSHVMAQIENICDRAIWIEDGLIKMEGSPSEVGKAYLGEMNETRNEKLQEEFEERQKRLQDSSKKDEKSGSKESEENAEEFFRKEATRTGTGKVKFIDAGICNSKNEKILFAEPHSDLTINMKARLRDDFPMELPLRFVVNIGDDNGKYLSGIEKVYNTSDLIANEKDLKTVSLKLKEFPIKEGRLLIDIAVQAPKNPNGVEIYDRIDNAFELRFKNTSNNDNGMIFIDYDWNY